MKRFLTVLTIAVLTACATPGMTPGSESPVQQTITATTNSYNGLDVGILSATAAVKSGALKGNDAANVYRGLVAAKAALDPVLLALRNAQAAAVAASAASGATK